MTTGFFHGAFPRAPDCNIIAILIFSKILENIRSSMCTTSINDTGGKLGDKISDQKGLKYLLIHFFVVGSCVADPDPRVFGPPESGSGSTSQRYGSGSFYHQAKIVRKTLIPTI